MSTPQVNPLSALVAQLRQGPAATPALVSPGSQGLLPQDVGSGFVGVGPPSIPVGVGTGSTGPTLNVGGTANNPFSGAPITTISTPSSSGGCSGIQWLINPTGCIGIGGGFSSNLLRLVFLIVGLICIVGAIYLFKPTQE